jgi:prophage DNA circulation protein
MSDLISLLRSTGSLADLAGQTASNVSSLAGNSLTVDNSGETWMGGTWINRLQPGSWRGVGFVLDAGETLVGRRLAIHEYPYRDTAWGEDLGKLPRRFHVQAFLVGDDVYAQRDALVSACEQPGSGTLVHPTLGSVECVLVEPCAVTDRRERGRVVEVAMQFMLASDVRFPGTSISSADAIQSAAGALTAASKGDLAGVLSAIPDVPTAAKQVQGFTSTAIAAVSDATRALNAVRGLAGNYGRFASGSRGRLQAASMTVQGALAAATTARTVAVNAAGTVNALASLL